MDPLVRRGGPASSANALLDPGQAVHRPCTDPSLCPTMSEHPSTSDLLSECNSGELPVAAHTLDRSAEPPLHPSTERPERLPRAGKVGGPADDPARTDTDHERSCEPVLEYRFPVSGLRHMTRAALRALHCDSCNGHGHESRDCPERERDSCIFCGSTEHRRGVHCDAPHVYGWYVVCGTFDTFQRLPPHQQRQRLRPRPDVLPATLSREAMAPPAATPP